MFSLLLCIDIGTLLFYVIADLLKNVLKFLNNMGTDYPLKNHPSSTRIMTAIGKITSLEKNHHTYDHYKVSSLEEKSPFDGFISK